MKWYVLKNKIQDNLGVIPPIGYDYDAVSHTYYKDKIKKHALSNFDEPIYLQMFDDYNVPLVVRDKMSWDSGSPMANIFLCSKKFKEQIETLNLLSNRFYEVLIRIQKKRIPYFAFHYVFDILEHIEYYISTFYVSEIGSEKILTILKEGEVFDKNHLSKLNTKLIPEGKWLQPLKLSFDMPPYDIWSLYGQHIISAKAMLLFEEAGITGIDMIPLEETEWKHLEIVIKPKETEVIPK